MNLFLFFVSSQFSVEANNEEVMYPKNGTRVFAENQGKISRENINQEIDRIEEQYRRKEI